MLSLENYRNSSFSEILANDRIHKLMAEFMMLTSRSGLSITEADVEEIGRASETFSKVSAQYFQMMHDFSLERRSNLERYDGIEMVSLGEDCFCRTVTTQWGLKKSAALGEKSMPFDLSVHPIHILNKLIKTDFLGYTDPENLAFDTASKVSWNRSLEITFNHEVGEKYAANDFKELRETYSRRVNQFRQVMESDKLLVCLLHVVKPSPETNITALKLIDTLQEKWRSASLKMVVINTFSHGKLPFESTRLNSDMIRFVDVVYPFPGYVWHVPSHCFSPEGHEFERAVMQGVKQAVDQWAGFT